MMLYTKETILSSTLETWKRDAAEKFIKKLTNQEKPFPCIPATIGQTLNHLRYGFVSRPDSLVSSDELSQLLKSYTKISRQIGSYTSLIVFYEPSEPDNRSVKQFERLFWDQLIRLHETDPAEWPGHIPPGPHNPLWEFCFDGEQYFMYCATPAHQNRMSRHFPYFLLAITPRWVLREFHSSFSRAAKIKLQIRKRLEDYDAISVHPDLKSYGETDNFEWKQYFLRDDATALSKCPFHHFLNSGKPDEKY